MMAGLILLAVRRVRFGDRYRPDRSFGAASGGWPLSSTDGGSGIVVGGVARFLLVGLVFEAVSQRLGLLSAASGIQLTTDRGKEGGGRDRTTSEAHSGSCFC